MQPERVKIINDRLVKAVKDGVFNNLWFYIKDFNNYKLEIMYSYLDENEDEVSITIGEFNRYVYKNFEGKEIILKYDYPYLPWGGQPSDNNKYSIEDLYSEENLNKIKLNDNYNLNRKGMRIIATTSDSVYLRPEIKHFKENLISTELTKDFLFKVEESILNYCFNNDELKNLICDLQGDINIDDSVGDLDFISILSDQWGDIPNNIFNFNEQEFECRLKPLATDIFDEVNRILGNVHLASQIPKLPKSFLDDFIKTEKMEKTDVEKRIIFKEYHRIIETIINEFFYKKHFNKIIQICNKLKKEGKRNPILNDIIYYKEDFNVTNLKGVEFIMYILSKESTDIYNSKIKEIIKKEIIPTIAPFESLSRFKNCLAHGNPFLNNQLYIYGINSLKIIILKLHKIFNEEQ